MLLKTIKCCIVLMVILLVACGSKNNKQGKANWSQKERVEYMRDCITSARKTMTERGVQPDSSLITTLCRCSGEIIEERYNYKEASRMQQDEVKAIMQEAVKKCIK